MPKYVRQPHDSHSQVASRPVSHIPTAEQEEYIWRNLGDVKFENTKLNILKGQI